MIMMMMMMMTYRCSRVGLFSYLLLRRSNQKYVQCASGCCYMAHGCVISEHVEMTLQATTLALAYSY